MQRESSSFSSRNIVVLPPSADMGTASKSHSLSAPLQDTPVFSIFIRPPARSIKSSVTAVIVKSLGKRRRVLSGSASETEQGAHDLPDKRRQAASSAVSSASPATSTPSNAVIEDVLQEKVTSATQPLSMLPKSHLKLKQLGTAQPPSTALGTASTTNSSGAPVGISDSATVSRRMRSQMAGGIFKPNPTKLETWKRKILQIDRNAKFDDVNIVLVRHSGCGCSIKVKEPYDATRFRAHVKTCLGAKATGKRTASAGTPSLIALGQRLGWTVVPPKAKAFPPPTEPCPGINKQDNQLILAYLRRTSALGGGGQSVTKIAGRRYGKLFSKLSMHRQVQVLDAQTHQHKWRNHHEQHRIFSTRCKREVKGQIGKILPCSRCIGLLSNNQFKRALRVPIPHDNRYIYVNMRYRNKTLGHLYARIIGLRAIVEAGVCPIYFIQSLSLISTSSLQADKRTPCIQYCTGVLEGNFKNAGVFTGLVEAMVTKVDREERGVGMQNFSYAPAYDEFIHIIAIHSPQVHRFLSMQFPARTARNFRLVLV